MIVHFVDIAGIVDLPIETLFVLHCSTAEGHGNGIVRVRHFVNATPLKPYDGICSNWVGLLICAVPCRATILIQRNL